MFWKKKKEQNELIVTEGVAGMWFYHLSKKETPNISLCGKQTMRTDFPIHEFPIKLADHIPHGNCKRCTKYGLDGA